MPIVGSTNSTYLRGLSPSTWGSIADKPSVIAAGSSAAAARAAISAASSTEVAASLTTATGRSVAFAIALG